MKSVSAEKTNINEYIKSKLKAFADTFATLGEIIGGTSNASKMTDAEVEAAEIWKANPKSLKAVESLEARETIPEKASKNEMKKESRTKNKYEISPQQIQSKQLTRENSKNRTNTRRTKTIDDDYVK